MLTPWKKDRILGRSFLRKRNLSNRGGNDGCKYCPGNEPFFYGRDMDESDSGKKYWYEAIDEANDLIEDDIETDIQGYDIDEKCCASWQEKMQRMQELTI